MYNFFPKSRFAFKNKKFVQKPEFATKAVPVLLLATILGSCFKIYSETENPLTVFESFFCVEVWNILRGNLTFSLVV